MTDDTLTVTFTVATGDVWVDPEGVAWYVRSADSLGAGVHLEGMGVLGCYIAHRLDSDGTPFTWTDLAIDGREPVTAWKACTGAIFPTGHRDDMEAWAAWRSHLIDHRFAPFMELADYVFCTKSPPHGGRYSAVPLAGDVKLSEVPSLHLNAQTWVPATRKLFVNRYGGPSPRQQRVITHGFGPRLDRYMWGWTVPVRIKTTASSEQRPCTYFRRGRFVMAYAYPIPGTDLWYAGSSLISQRSPKQLTVEPKVRRWREDFLALGEGYVTDVELVGPAVEGWRPVPAADDTAWVRRMADGSLAVKPLWHSGVRHAPLVYDALKEAL